MGFNGCPENLILTTIGRTAYETPDDVENASVENSGSNQCLINEKRKVSIIRNYE